MLSMEVTMITTLTTYIARQRRKQQVLKALNARSDRQLEDMGIARGDIPGIAKGATRR